MARLSSYCGEVVRQAAPRKKGGTTDAWRDALWCRRIRHRWRRVSEQAESTRREQTANRLPVSWAMKQTAGKRTADLRSRFSSYTQIVQCTIGITILRITVCSARYSGTPQLGVTETSSCSGPARSPPRGRPSQVSCHSGVQYDDRLASSGRSGMWLQQSKCCEPAKTFFA